jgi:Flp pilus assembly protein TadG
MDTQNCPSLRQLLRQERGGVAVEFAIVFLILLLLVFGIVDFGHAWYMDHMMSNASREGARYGTRYYTVSGSSTTRKLPQNLNPTISDYVKYNSSENGGQGGFGLIHLLPADANVQVTPSGPGLTMTDPTQVAGKDLTVTVTARKNWFVIGKLVPGLGSYKDITVRTTMKCE